MPAKRTPRLEFPKGVEALSKFGAGLLCDCIMDYWVKRGYGTVKAERYPLRGDNAWGVRSNLYSGLPPARGKRRNCNNS